MAPPRRGRSRSFPATELRGTLGTLLRTTLAQAGVVRDALERGAREGRARLDDVRSERRRGDALAELGELVLERVRRGELPELEDIPELADAIAAIEELDAPPRRRGRRDDAAPGRDWIEPASRSRFDRGRGRHDSESDVRTDDRDHPGDDDDDVFDDGYVGEAVRPAGGGRREPAPRSAGAASRGRGDGTVSSSSWTPPRPSSGAQRVWRPVMPEDPAPGHDHGHGDDHDDHDDDDARSPA
ncbi:MAG: hypothetical protein KC464_30975, partial [Myxococcales bacterium]|nr:hypothetical protein [Myxococcales bacterium]